MCVAEVSWTEDGREMWWLVVGNLGWKFLGPSLWEGPWAPLPSHLVLRPPPAHPRGFHFLSFFLLRLLQSLRVPALPPNIYFRNYQIGNNNEGRSILKSNWWCAFMVECQMIHVVTLPIKRTFNTTKPNIYKRTQIINTTYLCFISHLPFYAPMRSIKYKIHNSSKPPNGAFLCFLRDGDEPDDDHY